MDRKKELKELYKEMKPDMGVFVVKCKINNKCFLEAASNLRGKINGTIFKLNAGSHQNKELQRQWIELGKENFSVEILEKLEYDEEQSKTDYTEELELLKMIWKEKLLRQNMDFYTK
ncbi:MAG: GIY-YIG nuclease family protein [Clostridia bacterium]|nr:GIY-YIG nuclease family protein [Clostridia bacterium]